MRILDGTGSGKRAKVDNTNRLHTESVTQTSQLEAARAGDSYQVGTGIINLTTSGESAILYFKNNEDRDVEISAVNITSTAMTGSSSNVMLAKLYTDPTGITSGTSISGLNNNFGSNKTLTADITAGAEGLSFSGGSVDGAFYIPVDTFFTASTAWIVPKGVTLGVSLTPASGNTSVNVSITFEAHLQRDIE